QQRRLPRARWTQQGDKFTAGNFQVHIVERNKLAKSFADVIGFNAHAAFAPALVVNVGVMVCLAAKSSCCLVCCRDFHSTMLFASNVTSASSASNDATANAGANWYSL